MPRPTLCVLLLAIGISACTLDRDQIPPLTGPSENALSLRLTATPDQITQDGVASSLVEIVARDASSHPVHGLVLEAATFVGGVRMDFGSLSSRSISTTREGRAAITYYAPAAPPPSATDDVTVAVVVTPLGTNFANANERAVFIRLLRPGIVLPPNRPPVPQFFFSPTAPREGDAVLFDGSGSTDDGSIVSFSWRFGDGSSGAGGRQTHRYQLAGTYNVVLTVTDDRGSSASTPPAPITVVSSADPVASFAISPTEPGVGQPVHVNASGSKAAPGRTITTYAWDFGDGSSGSGVSTFHVYTVPGSYAVVLNVTDNLGRKATQIQTVTVKAAIFLTFP
jgi:PKD repeat protein